MHGGRAGGEGSKGQGAHRMIKDCDAEHENHEALVKHFEVGEIIRIGLYFCHILVRELI